jgi:hypothetical protein
MPQSIYGSATQQRSINISCIIVVDEYMQKQEGLMQNSATREENQTTGSRLIKFVLFFFR